MLSKFEKESLYFIEVNHMLEHCENPLGTINAHLQRLKVGGVCFHSIPDKRFSFDCDNYGNFEAVHETFSERFGKLRSRDFS